MVQINGTKLMMLKKKKVASTTTAKGEIEREREGESVSGRERVNNHNLYRIKMIELEIRRIFIGIFIYSIFNFSASSTTSYYSNYMYIYR